MRKRELLARIETLEDDLHDAAQRIGELERGAARARARSRSAARPKKAAAKKSAAPKKSA